MGKIINKSLILSRIKTAFNLEGNSELARFLGVAPNTITNWYKRNSLDYDIVFSKCVNINSDWLLTGSGEMLKAKSAENTTSTPAPNPQIPDTEYKDNNKNADLQENSATISTLLTTIQTLNRTIARLELQIEQLQAPKTFPSPHYQCA